MGIRDVSRTAGAGLLVASPVMVAASVPRFQRARELRGSGDRLYATFEDTSVARRIDRGAGSGGHGGYAGSMQHLQRVYSSPTALPESREAFRSLGAIHDLSTPAGVRAAEATFADYSRTIGSMAARHEPRFGLYVSSMLDPLFQQANKVHVSGTVTGNAGVGLLVGGAIAGLFGASLIAASRDS